MMKITKANLIDLVKWLYTEITMKELSTEDAKSILEDYLKEMTHKEIAKELGYDFRYKAE